MDVTCHASSSFWIVGLVHLLGIYYLVRQTREGEAWTLPWNFVHKINRGSFLRYSSHCLLSFILHFSHDTWNLYFLFVLIKLVDSQQEMRMIVTAVLLCIRPWISHSPICGLMIYRYMTKRWFFFFLYISLFVPRCYISVVLYIGVDYCENQIFFLELKNYAHNV